MHRIIPLTSLKMPGVQEPLTNLPNPTFVGGGKYAISKPIASPMKWAISFMKPVQA